MCNNEMRRLSNIELLRIIAMLLIVAHHYVVHGNFVSESLSTASNAVLSIISSGGKLGVNIFVLISGYFLTSKNFSINRMVKLLAQVTFYSVTMYILSVLLGAVVFRKRDIISSVFVFVFNETYWFALTYFVLLLVSPLINAGLKGISQRTHLILLLTFFVLWCIIPSCSSLIRKVLRSESIGIREYDFSILGWFVWLYATGAYADRTKERILPRGGVKTLGIITIVTIIIYIAALFSHTYIEQVSDVGIPESILAVSLKMLSMTSQNAMMPCVISILLFLTFTQIKIPYKRGINIVGGATFGVYLIHDNGFFSKYLWENILKNKLHTQPFEIIMHALVATLVVFAVCIVIELARQRFLEKPFFECSVMKKLTKKVEDYKRS